MILLKILLIQKIKIDLCYNFITDLDWRLLQK